MSGRIRLRRKLLGVSQAKLAATLGLTFQQIQKYERGANRVGASMLQALALALNASPAWFFDGLPPTQGDGPSSNVDPAAHRAVQALISTSEGLALARLMAGLPLARRRQVLALMEPLADTEAPRAAA